MIALRLLDVEWFKARHRAVFWVTTGFFAVLYLLMLGITQYQHAKDPANNSSFSLPGDWLMLLQGPGDLGVLLVIVTLVLLVASERTWRTQRQNVIDGLSRAQFFSGKLLLGLLLVIIFWLMPAVLGMVFAVFDGAPGYTDGTGPFLSPLVLKVFGGYFVHLAATAALAVMFGTIASSSGAALALTFVFMIGLTPITMLLAERGGVWLEIARRSPFLVFDQLTNPAIYDAAQRADFNERMPDFMALLAGIEANLLSLAYALLFITIAWLAFRRRDL
jgi:ABC-2 type transport system permease protein